MVCHLVQNSFTIVCPINNSETQNSHSRTLYLLVTRVINTESFEWEPHGMPSGPHKGEAVLSGLEGVCDTHLSFQ